MFTRVAVVSIYERWIICCASDARGSDRCHRNCVCGTCSGILEKKKMARSQRPQHVIVKTLIASQMMLYYMQHVEALVGCVHNWDLSLMRHNCCCLLRDLPWCSAL